MHILLFLEPCLEIVHVCMEYCIQGTLHVNIVNYEKNNQKKQYIN